MHDQSPMQVRVETPLGDLRAADWNRLAGDADPFLQYEYFGALEACRCSGPNSHWASCHITLTDAGQLVGVLPLFRKMDSWGEFVFDFAWANAYTQAGGQYYPKLVSALPYTPVGGRRLLVAAGPRERAYRDALVQGALGYALDQGVSSWHVLFCHADERSVFVDAGLLLRQDCQFHWFNHGYRDFEDYLATFRSSRRKKTRRERRHVREAGIDFRTLRGDELDAPDWQRFYEFYASSFLIRGRRPYFPADLFSRLARDLGERMLVKFAERAGQPVAAALFFRGADRLYGRYWGCTEHHDSLHFEACYYQGIEYCIAEGIAQFDPGTQGEHKITRGFRAQPSYSAHWLRDAGFRGAIADYLAREHAAIEDYMVQVDQHLPFRRVDPG